ncbi:hypothetical protein AB1207_24340 [Kineococcus endophyticus]|uniref:Secreted protein n=1 Tax=Kineococcus endophyticus TaxID=1181883 RepID=A0ABV3PEE2_9ACTN
MSLKSLCLVVGLATVMTVGMSGATGEQSRDGVQVNQEPLTQQEIAELDALRAEHAVAADEDANESAANRALNVQQVQDHSAAVRTFSVDEQEGPQ